MQGAALDDILDQCSKKGWPYPSMEEWSPSRPAWRPKNTAPLEALKLAPSAPMVVVSEVAKPQGHHTTSTEPKGETPAVDLDLETVTDSVKDSPVAGLTLQTGVEFPDAENRETVKRVAYPLGSEEGEEADSDSLHALKQAAQQLAEQAVSPLPRTEVLSRTPQIEQAEQEISQLQKKQSFKANAGAAKVAETLKNEVQKVLLNVARKRDPALFQQSIKRLDALEID